MKDIIVIAIIVIIGAVVMISAIPVERESKRRLQRYWNRMCTGKEWRRRFPDATKDEIRRFLETFVDGFTFQSSQRLKFEPNDKVMDIYRALYPSTGWPDASEVETFARNLKREYAFDLAKVEDPHVTLGQLFMMIRNPNQRRHPTALIAPLVRRNVGRAEKMKCRCAEFSQPLRTMADVRARCDAEEMIAATLRNTAPGDWRSVRTCSVCGALWCQEYPSGEMHGGGAPCSYRIDTDDPDRWLKETEYLTARIRERDDEAEFIASLGEEVGPAACRQNGCDRKTIRHSVFCRQHHFENIRAAQKRK